MKKLFLLSIFLGFLVFVNLAQADQIVKAIPFVEAYYSLVDNDSGQTTGTDPNNPASLPLSDSLNVTASGEYILDLEVSASSQALSLNSSWTNYGNHTSAAESSISLLTDPFYAESITFECNISSNIDTEYDSAIFNLRLIDLTNSEDFILGSLSFDSNNNSDLNNYTYWIATHFDPSTGDHLYQLVIEVSLNNSLQTPPTGNATTFPTQTSSSFITLANISAVSIRYTDDNTNPVPEPSTVLSLGIFLSFLGLYKFKSKK